jgi:hypothetical protein
VSMEAGQLDTIELERRVKRMHEQVALAPDRMPEGGDDVAGLCHAVQLPREGRALTSLTVLAQHTKPPRRRRP